jgi:predicted RNase H-like HicB family nuclease
MLTEYIAAAMGKAKWDILSDDGSIYAEIPALPGVYSNNVHLEECLQELREVLEERIILSINHHLPLPNINGMEIRVRESE